MKIFIERSKFRDAVRRVAPAADKKGQIPILSNILIEAGDGGLRLSATDLEIGITTETSCTVEEEGRVTVNASKLLKVASNLSGNDVEMGVEGNLLKIRSSNSLFSLSTLPSDEFPELSFSGDRPLRLSSAVLDKALKKVLYAVGRDETRYVLTGVYITSTGGKVHFVATDGHRLSLYEVGVSAPEFGVIVPRRVFSEVRKLASGVDEVEITSSENQVFFNFGDTKLSSSVIEGDYPNYTAVIPEGNPLRCSVDRDEFLTALKEVSVIFDREDVKPVLINLSPKLMKLSARSDTGEEAIVEVPADYSGEDFRIGFNVVHLSEAVGSMESGDVVLLFDTPTTQALILSGVEPELKCVIMPMRV